MPRLFKLLNILWYDIQISRCGMIANRNTIYQLKFKMMLMLATYIKVDFQFFLSNAFITISYKDVKVLIQYKHAGQFMWYKKINSKMSVLFGITSN